MVCHCRCHSRVPQIKRGRWRTGRALAVERVVRVPVSLTAPSSSSMFSSILPRCRRRCMCSTTQTPTLSPGNNNSFAAAVAAGTLLHPQQHKHSVDAVPSSSSRLRTPSNERGGRRVYFTRKWEMPSAGGAGAGRRCRECQGKVSPP